MILSIAIQQLFPNADPIHDYIIQDDGSGPYIAQWNLPDPEPTPAELDAAWADFEAGQPARDLLIQQQVDAAAFTDLPEWAAYTTSEAVAAIRNAIFAGASLATVNAQIDALPATIAGMKTGLKAVVAEIITERGILEKMSKVIVYLRDRTG